MVVLPRPGLGTSHDRATYRQPTLDPQGMPDVGPTVGDCWLTGLVMTSETTTGTVSRSGNALSHSDKLGLLKRSVRPRAAKPPEAPAAVLPVAHVAVDLPLAHLDRPFDYLVPASMGDQAVPGSRVKVRFSGRDVNGYVLSRSDETAHVGRLSPLRRVVSSEPVLSPQVLETARLVADRYAGTLADVLRLAVPARHAKVEAEPEPEHDQPLDVPLADLQAVWEAEVGGRAWIDRLSRGGHPRAVWSAPAGVDWAVRLAASAAATRRSG